VHLLNPDQAVQEVEKVRLWLSSKGQTAKLKVVTGKGSHSLDGQANLRLAVEEYCRRKKLTYERGVGEGCIIINFPHPAKPWIA